jgi:hypothetical protein
LKRLTVFTTVLLAIIVLLVSCAKTTLGSLQSQNEKALKRAEYLSTEVKEFEKTLGIMPSTVLSKTTLQKRPRGRIWVYMQKQGLVSPVLSGFKGFNLPPGERDLSSDIQHYIKKMQEEFPDLDIYVRGGFIYATSSIITRGFANDSKANQVADVVHEDLHDNFHFVHNNVEEAITTAFAFIVAKSFFTKTGNEVAVANINKTISNRCVALSKSLRHTTELVNDLFVKFENFGYKNIRKRIHAYILKHEPLYEWEFRHRRADNPQALEALISHDLAYFGYCDKTLEVITKFGLENALMLFKTLPTDIMFPEYIEWLEQQLKK